MHWFRHRDGTTPICKVYRVEGGWELLFFRGPSDLGPHFYRSFEQLKNHLDGYLRCHGERLAGPRKDVTAPQPLYGCESAPSRPGLVPDPAIQVAPRRQRRRR